MTVMQISTQAPGMKENDFEFFKNLLLQQKSELLNKAVVFKEESLTEKVSHGDEGDVAASELSLSMHLRLQERQMQLLQKVDHALAKIDSKRFGLCECCEEPLALNRLKARPVASLCIACKEDQESTERSFASN